MGLFDQIVSGALRGALGETEQSALPGLLGQLLGQTNLGNVGGLLQQLQQGGLGAEVSSWVGNGSNLPVSPDQLRSALGNEQLQQLARQAGLPVDQLLAMLSQHLPQTVDRMSPNGALQETETETDEDQSPAAAGGSLAAQAGLGDVGRQ
jgi:uncharacterized protein YidB (DUF937 family)